MGPLHLLTWILHLLTQEVVHDIYVHCKTHMCVCLCMIEMCGRVFIKILIVVTTCLRMYGNFFYSFCVFIYFYNEHTQFFLLIITNTTRLFTF